MRRAKRILTAVLMVVAVLGWQLVGCRMTVPPDDGPSVTTATIKIDFAAGDNPINVYDVEAGVPLQRSRLTFADIDTAGITVNQGFFNFAVESLETAVSPAVLKGTVTQQIDAAACLDACATAAIQVAPEVCTDVCENNTIDVRMWINTIAAIEAACTDGDEYSFRLELDANNNVVAVTRDPALFIGQTANLINSGTFGGCIQVVAPFTGQVVLNELVITIEP